MNQPQDPLKFRGVAAVCSSSADPDLVSLAGPVLGTMTAPNVSPAYADDSALETACVPGAPDPSFDPGGRVCYGFDGNHERVMKPPTEALVVSSATMTPGVHRPVIDLDVPARLVPSSTPGHAHLYIDVDVPTDVYMDLLHALSAAGIVEPGFAAASDHRGASFARLPWVRKRTEDAGGNPLPTTGYIRRVPPSTTVGDVTVSAKGPFG